MSTAFAFTFTKVHKRHEAVIRRHAVHIGSGALMIATGGSGASTPLAEQSKCTGGFFFWGFYPCNRSLPASAFGKTHGVLLVQVKVSGKLPQVWFALGRLVDLKKQVDSVLPVSIWRKETETLRISFMDTEKAAFLLSSHQRRHILTWLRDFIVEKIKEN